MLTSETCQWSSIMNIREILPTSDSLPVNWKGVRSRQNLTVPVPSLSALSLPPPRMSPNVWRLNITYLFPRTFGVRIKPTLPFTRTLGVLIEPTLPFPSPGCLASKLSLPPMIFGIQLSLHYPFP